MFKKLLICTGLLICGLTPIYGQGFSCPSFKKPACLDYNDKVVDSSAKCYRDTQCGYEGFMCIEDCKSKVQKLTSKHNDLIDRYDGLVSCLSTATSMEDVERCKLYN